VTLDLGSPLPGFTGATLDRADHLRADQAGLEAAVANPRARLLMLDALQPLLADGGRLCWGAVAEAPAGAELILLGIDAAGTPHFVPFTGPVAPGPMGAVWDAINGMPGEEAALYAGARSLVDWHSRHRFCANCGTGTVVFRAGWGRKCPGCSAEHYPRVDPVVIMLAEHDGRVLVGRQPRFPAGRYSALAGFVEPGESIEEAVARELWEEAGVRATSVRYIASQPWPFPSSLMIAAVAPVADPALTLDATEIEDAFWATREDIAASLDETSGARFLAPPPFAIANTLLTRWLAEQG